MEALPQEFIEQAKTLLGADADAFLESLAKEPVHALRINPLRGDGPAIADLLCRLQLLPASDRGQAQVPWEPNGYYYEKTAPAGKHVLFEAGFYYIQEPSAMAPAAFLQPVPGERILDLCAAPGGKSTQIGAALQGRGLLVSNEIHPARAKVLSENIERMGIANCIVTNESPDRLAAAFPLYFDKVLVDAPCSGEGMFRKNEEALSMWSPENVAMCAARQREILEHAHIMLRPGGRLVYSTCTFSPAENEETISAFCEKHPEYSLLPLPLTGHIAASSLQGGRPVFEKDAANGAMLRLFPHLVTGEGHFVAVLQKGEDVLGGAYRPGASAPAPVPVSSPAAYPDTSASRYEKRGKRAKGGKGAAASQDFTPLFAFFKDLLSEDPQKDAGDHYDRQLWERLVPLSDEKKGRMQPLFSMGAQLYLLPSPAPMLDGLKLLRPGLHLGSLEKGRFTPSLSLARALSVYDINNYVNLSASSEKDRALLSSYLAGNTFPYEGKPGFCLISMDGRGISWGKLAGGIMKNHYPKGLRKNTVC